MPDPHKRSRHLAEIPEAAGFAAGLAPRPTRLELLSQAAAVAPDEARAALQSRCRIQPDRPAAIPVAFDFQVLNVTQGEVIFSDSAAVGRRNAYPNQATEGTHTETLVTPEGEIPPTNRRVTGRGVEVLRIEGGEGRGGAPLLRPGAGPDAARVDARSGGSHLLTAARLV